MAEGNSSYGSVALLVVGLVILVPSGLCTGVFALAPLVEMMTSPNGSNGEFDMLPVALMIGGPFIVIGGLMVWRGWRGTRRKGNDAQS